MRSVRSSHVSASLAVLLCVLVNLFHNATAQVRKLRRPCCWAQQFAAASCNMITSHMCLPACFSNAMTDNFRAICICYHSGPSAIPTSRAFTCYIMCDLPSCDGLNGLNSATLRDRPAELQDSRAMHRSGQRYSFGILHQCDFVC